MSVKIPWREIYSDFRRRHPNLAKKVLKWHPHDFLTILLYLEDGMKITYDYFDHKATILSSRWKNN